jgi:CubicO group peptidase (beta-lactamase class C family)
MLADIPAIMGAVNLNKEDATAPWVRSLLDINCYAELFRIVGGQAIQLELLGDVDEGFTGVAEAFMSGFSDGRDIGGALAVFVDGRLVVDVWSGYLDRNRKQLWSRDTLSCLFSATKGVSALCVLQAVAENLLQLDEPVVSYWPEFDCHGKSQATVRHLLSHQAGLVGFHEPVERDLLYNFQEVAEKLAQEHLWWVPGEMHGYHARTFGYLLGEVLMRASGRSIGAWFQSKVAGPYNLDFHIGLNESDLARCAQMLPARVRPGAETVLSEASRKMLADYGDISTPTGAAFQNPSLGPGYMNSDRFRTSELPAMNGHGTARSLASVYSNIGSFLPMDLLEEATTTHSLGPDEVLKSVSHFGLGFMLHHDDAPIGVRGGSFGHAGAGGPMAFCDPDAGRCRDRKYLGNAMRRKRLSMFVIVNQELV